MSGIVEWRSTSFANNLTYNIPGRTPGKFIISEPGSQVKEVNNDHKHHLTIQTRHWMFSGNAKQCDA